MSPTSRTPGHSAVKSRPIRSGLVTACTGPGGALAGTWLTRLQAELAYQVGDQADAARDAVTIERGGHPPTAVGAPRGGEHLPHVDGQLTPARGAGGLGPVAPGVERRPGHPEQPARPHDRVGRLLPVDHRAPHRYGCGRAKKA